MRANYHTHCEFCDGRASAATMARAARAAGYEVLGFSSHAPLGPEETWSMRRERLPEYRAEIRRLAEAWREGGTEAAASAPMEILLGLEVDWLPGRSRPGDAEDLDYVLGSVHYAEAAPGQLFTVDCSEEHFAAALAKAAAVGGDVRALYRDYYRRLGDLAESGGFDILGHFDLVKKNNAGFRWFDETARDYLEAALEAAERVGKAAERARNAGRPLIVEINLGGMARGKTKEPYPSLAILAELHRFSVPITFCADAHDTGHLGVHLDAARELAAKAGYGSVSVLSGGRWIEVGLDRT